MKFSLHAQEVLKHPTYITGKTPELYKHFAASKQIEVINDSPIKLAQVDDKYYLYLSNKTRSEPLAVFVYTELSDEHCLLLAVHTVHQDEGYLLTLFLYVVWLLKLDVLDGNVITKSGFDFYAKLVATDAFCKYRSNMLTGEAVSEVPSWEQDKLPEVWASVIGKGIDLDKIEKLASVFKGYP